MTAGASRRLVVTLSGLALAVALLLALPAAASAAARPVVASVSPAKGTALGGTTVTVRGRNFRVAGRNAVKAVKFGSRTATKIHVVSATKLRCLAPRGVGVVNVRVVTKAGTSATLKADRFAYQGGPPVVTGISPHSGSSAGGTVVTVTGSGLTGATAVMFGAVPAESFTVQTDNSLSALAPQGAPDGTFVDVVVATPLGVSPPVAADQFTYYEPATVSGVSPNRGPGAGGNRVTITGDVLAAASAVSFGGAAAVIVSRQTTQLVVQTPPGIGIVDVRVTTPAGTTATSAADQYTYVAAPSVSGLSPTSGPLAGGTPVTISGSGFTGATAVDFGSGNPASNVDVVSASEITCDAPAGSGTVDVTVTTVGGTSATSSADQYAYT
jgi:hypothetical protein